MILIANASNAQDSHMVEQHPAYIHALADLRAARWLLNTKAGGNWQQGMDERNALGQIDAAMSDIRAVGIDDRKRQEDHGKLEDRPDHMGRLHEAIDFLKQARADLLQGEDDMFGNRLRERTYKNIDKAIESIRMASHS